MIYIFTDIERFTYYIPTAAGSNLEDLRPFLIEAEYWMMNEFLGAPLCENIGGMEADAEAKEAASLIICLKAYHAAIPFVDLIQTPNGFAVVSNTNQAPASKERVERLLLFVEKRLTVAIDTLTNLMLGSAGLRYIWSGAPDLFNRYTETVFLTTAELQRYSAKADATYKDMSDLRVEILRLQAEVARYISAAYVEELIEKRITDALNSYDNYVYLGIKKIIGLMLQKVEYYHVIEDLLNYMEERPVRYPTYINSTEYRLKMSKKYENKRHHSTFFFQG
jgi:hypothetical protein